MPLTLNTFLRDDANNGDREIYCRTHVGKSVRQVKAGQVAPMGVEGPNTGPGKKYIFQVSLHSLKTESI